MVRDFALGVFQNDPMASVNVGMKVQEQFNQAVDRQIRLQREKDRADREKAEFIWTAIGKARQFGGKHSKKLMKESMAQLGIDMPQFALDVLTDHDETTTEIMEKIREGDLGGAELEAIFSNSSELAGQIAAAKKAIHTSNAIKAQVQNIDRNKQILAEGQRKALKPASTRERAIEVMRIYQEQPPELAEAMIQQKYGEFVGMNPKKVQRYALGRYEKDLSGKEMMLQSVMERTGLGLPQVKPGAATPPPATTTDDWIARSTPVLKK